MYILLDYQCPGCLQTEEHLEKRGQETPTYDCPCGGQSQRCLSPVRGKTVWGYVSQGSSQERPPWALDTRALAEGQTVGQWRRTRDSARRDDVRRSLGVDPKVYV